MLKYIASANISTTFLVIPYLLPFWWYERKPTTLVVWKDRSKNLVTENVDFNKNMKIFFNPVTNSQIWEWDQNIYACISTYSMILEWDQNIWAWIWTYSHIWESDHDISIYLGVDIVIYPCDQDMIKYVGVDMDLFSDLRKRSTISWLDWKIYCDRLNILIF